MFKWFKSISIRWQLQISFMVVTMITTVFNRMLASHELQKMTDIATQNGVPANVIALLDANHNTYIFNSFWESGLEFAIQFFFIGLLANMFVRPLVALVHSLEAVEKGDLTKEVADTSRDEIGMLGHGFNEVLAKLNNIMREIDESGKKMGQSAYQIKTISRDINEVSKKEQTRSADVNAATSELNNISIAVQAQTNIAAEQAKLLEARGNEGISTVQRNIDEMKETVLEVGKTSNEIAELSESANQIHHIIATIREIADQTNLLALNAAIEAARAGEQGRGFAVVADEVRKLAERTTQSAVEVSNIIGKLSEKVGHSTDAMKVVVSKVHGNQQVAAETAQVIESMVEGITKTAKANQGISEASYRQIDQLKQLQSTLDELFLTLTESSTKVDTTAIIGDNLFEITENLNALMAGFVFEREIKIDPKQHVNRLAPRADNNLLVRISQNNLASEAVSLDFSLTGMRLALPVCFNKNLPLDLGILLPDNDLERYSRQTPLRATGEIAWQRQEGERYLYGIQFADMDAVTRDKLKDCFAFFNKSPVFKK